MIEIKVLKTSTCPNCGPASELVKRVAAKFNEVEVKEILLDKDPKEMQRAAIMGISLVPTILINGVVKFTGIPNEEKLEQAIREAFEE